MLTNCTLQHQSEQMFFLEFSEILRFFHAIPATAPCCPHAPRIMKAVTANTASNLLTEVTLTNVSV